MNKNYINIVAFDEDKIVYELPDIKGIKALCGHEAFTDILNVEDIVELAEADSLDNFVHVVYDMAIDYVIEKDDDIWFDNIIIGLFDLETESPVVGIHVLYDIDEDDIVYHLMSFDIEDNCDQCDEFNFEFFDEDED